MSQPPSPSTSAGLKRNLTYWLCRANLIHGHHCHLFTGPWGWRHYTEVETGGSFGADRLLIWNPLDWFRWLVFDCNRCGVHGCPNWGDC